jgi:hypothetical protein
MSRRNPFVAQTQILMAVVAGAMMMVVGDSAARAFGIFAAASLVRFRTNIRDPKEITVLLICLGSDWPRAWDAGTWPSSSRCLFCWRWRFWSTSNSRRFSLAEITVKTRKVDRTNQCNAAGLLE